ncbi:hypothetical protein HBI80_238080 [Parastagonospora nodorum]|nr:hypothetical protein HBI80_238080 [Parastagonospora nodorum]
MPPISCAWACGLAKHLQSRLETITELERLLKPTSNHLVTLIYSGMSFADRRVQYDAFNDIACNLRYMVTTVELLAEGVSLTGANHVIIESPAVQFKKHEQFKRRPIRAGQKEKKVVIRQMYNPDSHVDKRIMNNRYKAIMQSKAVGAQKVTDTGA